MFRHLKSHAAIKQESPLLFHSVWCASLVAFFLLAHYGAFAPSIDSLFLDAYGSDALPLAWLCSAGLILLLHQVYSTLLNAHQVIDLLKMSLMGGSLVLGFLFSLQHIKEIIFLTEVWKETFFVLLIEMFWTHMSLTFSKEQGKKVFGIFLAAGTVGTLFGHFTVGALTAFSTTSMALWLALFYLMLTYALTAKSQKQRQGPMTKHQKRSAIEILDSFAIIKESRYLFLLVILMLISKLCMTFVDFSYHQFMQETFQNMDERTAKDATIRGFISLSSIALQLSFARVLTLTSFKKVTVFVPLSLLITTALSLLTPLFNAITLQAATKAFHYSYFSLGKQMLYMPLSDLEKTKGRAFIDILMFRFSKGLCAGILMALISTGLMTSPLLTSLICLTQGIWIYLAYVIATRYGNMEIGLTEKLKRPSSI